MTKGATAYPLAWPLGWPRTDHRQTWPGQTTLAASLTECQAELRRLGATNIVLSSNVTLGSDKPADPGVVAYCTYDGLQVSIPCDRWTTVAGNLRAIAKTIEALRGMERWGAKNMVRAMFTGFVALPAPMVVDDWRITLGNPKTLDAAERVFREAIKRAHPDAGGSQAQSSALTAAIAAARAAFRA